MSYIGTTELGKIFLGTTEIDKAYLGSTLVFESGSPTPPAPTPVFYDRLIFDGSAYINTDIVLPTNCSIRVYIGSETQKKAQRVFRATTNGLLQLIYTSNTTSTNRRMGVYYDSTSLSDGTHNVAFSTTGFTFFMTPKGWGRGNQTFYSYTKGSSHPTGGLQIGGWDSGQPFTGQIATFRVYGSDAQNCQTMDSFDNYTSVYTLRPCTYNGEAGLWCDETNKFYGNSAGAGTLTVANV